jgi:hypothetical protein
MNPIYVSLKFSLSIVFLIIPGGLQFLNAQCNPPMAETCQEAQVICSLDELNGYSCSNPSSIPSQCVPLCSHGGAGNNTGWWAFVSQGGTVSLTLTVGSCSKSTGIQYGIYGNCDCGQEVLCRSIPCIPPNSMTTSTISLLPCKTYYLWVDGCSGDICNFTVNVNTGGNTPSLSPLGFINNIQNKIIESVCTGACDAKFFINPQPGGCSPTYVWTLDGDEVGSSTEEILLDFPNEGDFLLCVTAYNGNPRNGSICSMEGPQCATVRVRTIADKIGTPRVICWEQANPGGYKWFQQRITTTGLYKQQFTDSNCCKFDSVIEFIVLDPPGKDNVFYVTCDSTPFVDPLGNSWYGCRDSFFIRLPRIAQGAQCDSAIYLSSAFLSVKPYWEILCQRGIQQLVMKPDLGKLCSLVDSLQIAYSWYRMDDPDREVLSQSDTLDIINGNSYCVELDLLVSSKSLKPSNCKTTFCYHAKSDSILTGINPTGPLTLCSNDIGTFRFDSSLSPGTHYQWSSDQNAVFHSSRNTQAKVSWSEPGIKTICVTAFDILNSSCLYCHQLEIIKAAQTGRDFKVLGLQTRMKAKKTEFGIWKQISGPVNAIFENVRDPNSRVKVFKSGRYIFEWGALYKNCVDKDSVAIDFFTKPIDPTHLIFFTDDDETNYQDIEERNQSKTLLALYTPSLITSQGISYIKTQENLVFEKAEYSWKNSSGQHIFSGRIENNQCLPVCNFKSPTFPGLYFLLFEIEGHQLVKKVIVMN